MKTYLQEIKEKITEAGFKKYANSVSLHHTGKIALAYGSDTSLFDKPEELIEFLNNKR